MKIASLIARILLGLVMVFAGVTGLFMTPPPMPGVVGLFNALMYATHYMNFISFAQLVIGVLLLINRFVPVALIMLAAFTYNSFAFHITMFPAALWAPVLLVILGTLVALPYRRDFAPIFQARPTSEPVVRVT